MERFVMLSSMTWQEISQAHRHGLGFEKIATDSLHTSNALLS